jgi:hypothetical protein
MTSYTLSGKPGTDLTLSPTGKDLVANRSTWSDPGKEYPVGLYQDQITVFSRG